MRKNSYKTYILKSDYFVISHLQRFINKSLETYLYNGCSVADIGCGEQPLKEKILKLGANYIGFDIQQNTNNTVDVICFAEDLKSADMAFDVVLCTEVLEHVNDYKKSFAELVRVLKKDGILIITTPFMYPLHEEPHDKQRLTIHNFFELAKTNDLTVISIGKTGNDLEVLATLWDRMWLYNGKYKFLKKIRNTFARSCVNLPVYFFSKLFSSWFPKKSYLNNIAVLKK